MANELYVFESAEFGQVRTMSGEHGNPWFVAKDVCRVLDLDNNRQAVEGLDDDEKITVINSDGNPRAGIPHRMTCISESGLYSLIFRSRKPEAKSFSKWVRAEVLPSIRMHGAYVDEARVDPTLLRQLADKLEEKNRKLREARPAITLCNRLTEYRTEWPLGIAAKEIGAFVNTVRDTCVIHRILERVNSYGRWRYLPTKKALKNGLCVQERGGEKYAFTIKGIEWLRQHDAA